MVRVLKSNSTAKNPHETRENNEPTLQTRMHRVAIQIASTGTGQTMMMQLDKLLWTFEKTATWISNGKTGEGKRVKASVGLVRPLPWVFFLPTLVALRFTRLALSLVAIILGFNEIEASMMVSYLRESRRSMRHILLEAKRNKKPQISFADYVKQLTLTSLTQLNNIISPKPNKTIKVNNKTSLNASVITETENDDRTTSQSEGSDMEEKIYKNFLKNDILTSDSDDEDYLNELNGEYISDTDSEDSVATEDLTDDERKSCSNEMEPSKSTNGNAADHDDSNYWADTCSLAVVEQPNEDAQPSSNENDAQIDAMDRLFDGDDAKDVAHNRGKNANRPHKNGRNHTKSNNNGKHFNGAHGQAKNKTAEKQHEVESTTDFIADATAADRT